MKISWLHAELGHRLFSPIRPKLPPLSRSIASASLYLAKLLDLGNGELSDEMQFPTTQRELFDKLQLRLIVFKDKIEVKAIFPVADILNQECTFTRD